MRFSETLGDPLLLHAYPGMVPTAKAQRPLAPTHQAVGQSLSVLGRYMPFDPLNNSRTLTSTRRDTRQSDLLPGLVQSVQLRMDHRKLGGLLTHEAPSQLGHVAAFRAGVIEADLKRAFLAASLALPLALVPPALLLVS